MFQNYLKMFATSLATYARKEMPNVARGSLMIRLVSEGKVIAGVFGNANYSADERARQEVALVRQRLKEAGLDVMQFGLSLDGFTWSLLVRIDEGHYQTEAGKALQRELLKVRMDEIVEESCRATHGDEVQLTGQRVEAVFPGL